MSSQENLLKIGFSIGSIFDTKEVETIYETQGLKAYLQRLEDMNKKGEVFLPGPALGLYMAFKDLQTKIPKEVLDIKFGMVSRINPNPKFFGVFLRSIRHWILEEKDGNIADIDKALDYCCYTNGESTVQAHLSQESDMVFTTSEESAKELYRAGIPAITIPNENPEKNMEFYKKKDGKVVIVADYDGVIGDSDSEAIFQAARSTHDNPVMVFNQHEIDNRNVPMSLGPLGLVIKKLGRVVESFEDARVLDESALNPLKIIVVTARGVSAIERFMYTIGHHDITISQLYMMDGLNKNIPLEQIAKQNQGSNILFIDDSEIHFTRSSKLVDILSGWVKTDLNINEIEKQVKEKSLKGDNSANFQEEVNQLISNIKGKKNSKTNNSVIKLVESSDSFEEDVSNILSDIKKNSALEKGVGNIKNIIVNTENEDSLKSNFVELLKKMRKEHPNSVVLNYLEEKVNSKNNSLPIKAYKEIPEVLEQLVDKYKNSDSNLKEINELAQIICSAEGGSSFKNSVRPIKPKV